MTEKMKLAVEIVFAARKQVQNINKSIKMWQSYLDAGIERADRQILRLKGEKSAYLSIIESMRFDVVHEPLLPLLQDYKDTYGRNPADELILGV